LLSSSSQVRTSKNALVGSEGTGPYLTFVPHTWRTATGSAHTVSRLLFPMIASFRLLRVQIEIIPWASFTTALAMTQRCSSLSLSLGPTDLRSWLAWFCISHALPLRHLGLPIDPFRLFRFHLCPPPSSPCAGVSLFLPSHWWIRSRASTSRPSETGPGDPIGLSPFRRPILPLQKGISPGSVRVRSGVRKGTNPAGGTFGSDPTIETQIEKFANDRRDGRRSTARKDLHEGRDRAQDGQVRVATETGEDETVLDRRSRALTPGRTQERGQQRQSGTSPGRLHPRSRSGRRMRKIGGKSAVLHGDQVSHQRQSPSESTRAICGSGKSQGERDAPNTNNAYQCRR